MVPSIGMYHSQFNLTSIICLLTVKWLNSSIWPLDGTLTSSTTPGESGPESNGNKGVLYIPQSSRIGASPLDAVCYHIQDTHLKGVIRGAYDKFPDIFHMGTFIDSAHMKL